MKFFVDTAKIEDIKKANEMGVICGVTTNPSLIAKEGGKSQEEVLKEIASIVDGPISGEVKATTVDAEGMIKEGREIAKLHENMVVKIPMTVEGLKATIFAVHGIETEIIAASVRNPIHVTDCALAGADIATVPYNVIEQMTKHPLTDIGIEKFQKDYIAVFGK